MKWFLGTYTMSLNRRHHYSGHLFGGRYKAQVIDETTPGYLRTAADYVHLNPARDAGCRFAAARTVGSGAGDLAGDRY